MKNFQTNLFIILAICLCGLCTYQWWQQNQEHNSIEALNHLVFEKESQIQSATNSIAVLNRQVEQLDASLQASQAVAATNVALVALQAAQISRLDLIAAGMTNQIEQYQAAVATLESHLKDAYAGIERQNSAITNLVAQRDEFVSKYNACVSDRNAVVEKYNELAKAMAKMSAGTNNHDTP